MCRLNILWLALRIIGGFIWLCSRLLFMNNWKIGMTKIKGIQNTGKTCKVSKNNIVNVSFVCNHFDNTAIQLRFCRQLKCTSDGGILSATQRFRFKVGQYRPASNSRVSTNDRGLSSRATRCYSKSEYARGGGRQWIYRSAKRKEWQYTEYSLTGNALQSFWLNEKWQHRCYPQFTATSSMSPTSWLRDFSDSDREDLKPLPFAGYFLTPPCHVTCWPPRGGNGD